MSDKIEEIRARHAHDNRDGDIVYPGAHRDRSFLLAEVEYQRADNERLRAEIERMRAEIDGLEAELALMKSGFEVAYRMLGDKP